MIKFDKIFAYIMSYVKRLLDIDKQYFKHWIVTTIFSEWAQSSVKLKFYNQLFQSKTLFFQAETS